LNRGFDPNQQTRNAVTGCQSHTTKEGGLSMTEIKRWLTQILELALLVVALLALVQVLFGANATQVFGVDVIKNIGDIAKVFGNAGLVGVVAAGIVAWLILRQRPSIK
jgi:hypothetical protein